MMQPWLIYALLSALSAALGTIFARIGVEGLNSNLATAIRSVVMAVYLCLVCTALRLWPKLPTLNRLHLLNIVLSGLAGATSWLFMYKALSLAEGKVFRVSAVDKLSVPLAVAMAFIFLSERPLTVNWIGIVMIVAGVYCVAYKPAAPATAPRASAGPALQSPERPIVAVENISPQQKIGDPMAHDAGAEASGQ